MAAYDPRDDVPDADRAEQERDVFPETDQDNAASDEVTKPALPDDLQVDPLRADEADQIDQSLIVPEDDEYDGS